MTVGHQRINTRHQEVTKKAVDMLYDNSSDLDTHPSYSNKALKSISEMLKGKNGRFR